MKLSQKLADSIMESVNTTIKFTTDDLAAATAKYEEGQREVSAAWDTLLANKDYEKSDELNLAVSRAQGTLRAYEWDYYYALGKQAATELLTKFINASINAHFAVYGKNEETHNDDETAAVSA